MSDHLGRSDVGRLRLINICLPPFDPADECLAACQIQNDSLTALMRKHPRRIVGLGVVPLQDVALAIAELERIMKAGLKGIEIGTNVNGEYPGETRFRPFWEACEALGALVFVHPLEGGGRPELRNYYLWNVIGNPIETTIAAAHLILSGVMQAHPRLKILLAHGGGALPYLRGRLDRGFRTRPEISKVIAQPPTAYLKCFYFDSITHDPAVLPDLVAFHQRHGRLATVTAVRVTPDLRQAFVGISVIGSAKEKKQTLEGLRAAAPFIRRVHEERAAPRRLAIPF